MYIFVAALILIFAGALLYTGFTLANRVISPKVLTYDDMISREENAGRNVRKELAKLPKEEIYITSPFGYKLYGMFIPVQNTKKAVIICHGITCNIYASVKYIDLFRKRGFSVFIYDQRNHGKSGGKYTTFGYFEKYDLKACADWVRGKMGQDAILGVMGESMGAATALQSLSVDKNIAFCIADCSYSDLRELLDLRLKIEYNIPGFLFMPLARIISEYKSGMSFNKVSPIKDVTGSLIPTLFIHGIDDDYIPAKMSMKMFEAKKGVRQIYIAKGAKHAQSLNADSREYDKKVGEFLNLIKV